MFWTKLTVDTQLTLQPSLPVNMITHDGSTVSGGNAVSAAGNAVSGDTRCDIWDVFSYLLYQISYISL